MIFGKTRLELKVGIFIFIGAIIFTAFILLIGSSKTWKVTYLANFEFNFVNGVKIGAPVRFAGVDVGEVRDIVFVSDGQGAKNKVDVVCRVRKDIKIPLDSSVWVNTLGLLGERYIEIMPGKDYSKVLLVNQKLTGEDPIPVHELSVLAKRIGMNIDTGIERVVNKEGTLGKLLYDDAIYNELNAFVADIRKHPWKLLIKTKDK